MACNYSYDCDGKCCFECEEVSDCCHCNEFDSHEYAVDCPYYRGEE